MRGRTVQKIALGRRTPAQGAAKISLVINLVAIGGGALVEAVAPGFVPIGLDEDRADMQIHTIDHKAVAAQWFHVGCFIDRSRGPRLRLNGPAVKERDHDAITKQP